MAIHGVDTKCYILALFVRDDGERFLLGSGHYEFKDTQMHFAANAIQNDIVEVQGNDGFLLAGQVRRPGTQSFDGYVGDGTMSKEDTESYRRRFFSFFRKNFFYKVIYVFSDGTAIQRKRGFLVDDPTVQELYQIYPEYHVALNFEDVNYYSYSEDDEGHEQYAKEADIDLSSMRATGGLIWDNLGVVWENPWGDEQSVSGTELTIQNNLDLMVPVNDEKIEGDTYQQTYSGKNLWSFNTGTFTNNSGSSQTQTHTDTTLILTAAGTTGAQFISWVTPELDSTKTYTISGKAKKIVKGTDGQPYIRVAYSYSDDGSTWASNSDAYNNASVTQGEEYSFSYTLPSGHKYYRLRCYNNTYTPVTIGENTTYYDLQLEANTIATAFEPYVGGIPAPNPSYPQDINVVTGTQTITLNDNDSNTHTYTINLGSTELCKISNYQDYIYKSGGDWYVHKNCGKVIFNGTENWSLSSNYTNNSRFTCQDVIAKHPSPSPILSNYFTEGTAGTDTQNICVNGSTGKVMVTIANSKATTAPELTTWLSAHNTTVYYVLATPTDTKITNASLVTQLNALGAMRLFIGENNLTVQATGTNLPGPISFKYYTSVSMTGAEWEEGGSGGATVVEVDSITNIYPIWKVTGPAVNPELSVITTNTTIQYSGTITGTQTLEVDMFNKTAKLNGASVIGNISGDWVNFSPGTNRVLYTADNTDALPSTIEWQEVVG